MNAKAADRLALEGGRPVRTPDRYLVFGSPLIGEEEIAEVVATLRSGWIGAGPKVARFEREFAAYVDSAEANAERAPGSVPTHAVALGSCTAALHLAMLASGIGPGDEVITTPLTFCATVNSILHCGATPVLADVDPTTMNLDPEQVRRKLTPRTKAILPVHFAGRLCDMAALVGIAREAGALLIEDCAHAIETTGPDTGTVFTAAGHADTGGATAGQASAPAARHAGTFGHIGAFSFYVTKNVSTAEGGMIVTRDAELAARVKVMGLHGMSKDAWKRYSDEGYQHYDVVAAGFKYNMTDVQASLGLHQLARVERALLRREELWRRYDEAFADLPIELPAPAEPGTRHARHLYTIMVDEARCGVSRDRFLTALHAEGIGAGVHYRAIGEHAFYREKLGLAPGEFPNAESIGRRTVSLPLSAKLTDADAADVIAATRKILGRRGA